jgi:hypothetical protein
MRRLRHIPLRVAAAIVIGSGVCVGVAYAASLGLGSNKLFAWSQTLTKGTCNQTSATADDTYVQQSSPTSTAGGTATTLSVTNSPTAANNAFIRFNLSGCGLPTTAGADNATLTLVVTNAASGHTISVFPVYSSWSSSTLNYTGSLLLTVGSTATTTFASTTGSKTLTVTADVDDEIKAGAFWGWELKDVATGTSATTKIGAVDNNTAGNRPSMTLSYER